MKNFLNGLAGLVMVCCCLFIGNKALAQVGLQGLIVEEYYTTNAADAVSQFGIPAPVEGTKVYRIYADLAPGWRLQQVSGYDANPLEISTTTTFYNPASVGVIFGENMSGFAFGANGAALDSYLSLGLAPNGLAGIPKSNDPNGSIYSGGMQYQNSVNPINVVDGYVPATSAQLSASVFGFFSTDIVNNNTTNSLVVTNGSLVNLNASAGTGPENTVLIAQLSTTGELSFKLNLIVVTEGATEFYTHTEVIDFGGQLSTVFPGLIYPQVGISGCTTVDACNYNPAATQDDGSCTDLPVANCSECLGEILVAIDTDGDGVCDADEVPGCTASAACNFNPAATDEDGSCTDLPEANCSECQGQVLVAIDTDGDGICDADEIPGCTASASCNFNPAATDDDGSCTDAPVTDCSQCQGSTLVIVDTDGDGVCDAEEIAGCTNPIADNYNPAATDDDGSCSFAEALACDGEPGGLEGIIVEEYYTVGAADAVSQQGIQAPPVGAKVYRIYADLAPGWRLQQVAGYDANPLEISTTTTFYNPAGVGAVFGENISGFAFNANGTALDSYLSLGLVPAGLAAIPKVNDPDGSIYSGGSLYQNSTNPINVVDGYVPATAGQLSASTFGFFNTDFVSNNTANSVVVTNGALVNLNASAGTGPENTVLIAQLTTTGELSFKLNLIVVTEGATEFYNHSEVIDFGGQLSRVCSSLIYPGISGCTELTACNYNELATIDDGSCIVPVANCSECNATNDGLVEIDDDGDGVCNAEETQGCTDLTACNYDATVDAGNDDGSCIIPVPNCTACSNGALIDIDADNDGTCDALDNCPTDPNKTEPGICGCGNVDTDSDNDGTADCNDLCPGDPNKIAPGTCGCGVSDADSDNDGVVDCNDGCPSDPNKTAPGACGCGVADTDSDGDGIADCNDICPNLADLEPGDQCTVQGTGEIGFVTVDCNCQAGPKPQCISPVACNYFDPTGLVAGVDYINAPELCDEPVGCKSCDPAVDADDVDANGNPTPDGDGIGAAIFPVGSDTNGNMICDSEEPSGCTSSTACNYDPAAVNDDGSCLEPIAGCFVCTGNGGILFLDSDGDGVCNSQEVPGCTLEYACNYNEDATQNDGSCLLPEPGCSECNGDDLILTDANNNGTADCEEIYGCTNTAACNYDADATVDNGSCLVATPGCTVCTIVQGQYVLVTLDSDGDGVCNGQEVPGCTDVSACNYNQAATDENGSCIVPVENCSICNDTNTGLLTVDSDFDGICDADEVPGCTDVSACNYNAAATDNNGSCFYAVPNCTVCVNGTLIIQDNDLDGICNANDPDDDNDGCLDVNDPAPFTASADDDGDGVGNDCDICQGDDASGDTDGDGICDDSEIPGCTNAIACNFNAEATDDDGSCLVPVEDCYVCLNGDLVLVDADGDKICDADEVPGCTDISACNYNEDATDEDGSCTYVEAGCTRCNDGVIELIDTDGDGICDANEIPGCTDAEACNYNPAATDENESCVFPVEDCLACGSNGQLVIIDADNDGICDAEEIPGCTDIEACNYNANATDDNGSCLLPVEDCSKCELVGGTLVLVPIDADGDGICDADEIPGCTLVEACNYNPEATDAVNNTCILPVENCSECGTFTLPNGQVVVGLVIIDADGDKVCDADEVPGCTNPTAVNFDPLATDDDGSCLLECISDDSCESFENGFANWTNRTGDDMNWILTSGSTPSNGTGPDAAYEGSNYLYIESSFPNFPNKTAELESPCFELAGPTFVSFAYHMKGRNGSVGTLTLQIKPTANSAFVDLWSLSGNQGPNWNVAELLLPAISYDETVQFRIIATTAASFLGDIAIDNFCLQQVIEGCTDASADNYNPQATFDDGSCSFLNCANVRSMPYCRSFNTANNLGGFANVGGDDFNWLQNNGPTQSMYTGPSSGNTGSGYIYIEASAPNSPYKFAQIESPCIDLDGSTDPAVAFAYHMWGSYVGQLFLEISNDGVNWETIWFEQGNQGNQWNDVSISLDAYAGTVVKFRFTGVTFNGWQGDMAIDDFCVDNDPTAVLPIAGNITDPTLMASDLSKMGYELQAPESGEVSAELEINLYPNPLNTSDPLTIEFFNISADVNIVQVRIMDITGRQIHAEQFGVSGSRMIGQVTLDGNLASGTYLVSVVAGDEVKSKRLILTR